MILSGCSRLPQGPIIDAMKAAIIAVGSELLGTSRLDTNSLFLAECLERFGVEIFGKSVVGDDAAALADLLAFYGSRVEVVVLTGGLGPTADDITRQAVAQCLGREISIDESLVEELRQRFASFGLVMAEVNRRQAEVISGSQRLDNPKGSAPGQRLRHGDCEIFLLPGVPREMRAMVGLHLHPWLAERLSTEAGIERRTLKVACLPESEVEARIAPAYEAFGRQNIVVLASPGEVTLQAVASGPSVERRARLETMQQRLAELVGDAVFSLDERPMEAVVGELLLAQGATVATAESCTAGLVAERLTRVAGSSQFFVGGVVTYTNDLKQSLLGVDGDALERHGAVSESVGRQMAEKVRQRLESDYGIGITGIAGPGGGSEEKPVGTVHVAVAGPQGRVEHRRVRLPGDRQSIRQQSSQLALDLLRRMLLAVAPETVATETVDDS